MIGHRLFSAIAISLSAGICSAQYVPPTDAEADALIKVFLTGAVSAMLDEQLSYRIENGALSDVQARCVREQFKLDSHDMELQAREAVFRSFYEEVELREAMTFIQSPAGRKLIDFNKMRIVAYLHASLRKQPLPQFPLFPPSFNADDMQIAMRFMQSLAGMDYQAFSEKVGALRGGTAEHDLAFNRAISACTAPASP